MAKILVVEDDLELGRQLVEWLRHEKNSVEYAVNGTGALELAAAYGFDLIILDWELPDISGIEVCRGIRSRGDRTPIIMLTGKGHIDEKEIGFDSGCDDYLTKPFESRELAARMRALLRRPPTFTGTQLKVGNVTLEQGSRRVERDGQEVDLSPLEYMLLEFLMRNANQVFSPEALLNSVWTSDSEASIDTVRTYIKTLRKKLSNSAGSSIIRTIYGVGYKVCE